jgi:hypothetical protein
MVRVRPRQRDRDTLSSTCRSTAAIYSILKALVHSGTSELPVANCAASPAGRELQCDLRPVQAHPAYDREESMSSTREFPGRVRDARLALWRGARRRACG